MTCLWRFGPDDMYTFVHTTCKGKTNFDLKISFTVGPRTTSVLIIDPRVTELSTWVSYLSKKSILERGPKCVGAFVVIIITCWDIDFLLFETFFRKRLKNNCLPFLEIFLHMGLWEVDRFSKLCWLAGPLGSFAFFNLLGCRNDCQVHDRHKEEKHGHSFPSTTVMRISSTCQQRLVLVRSYKSVNFLRVLWQRKFCLCFEYWFVTW